MKVSELLEALKDRDPEQRMFVLWSAGQAYPIAELRATDVQLPGEDGTTAIILAVTAAPAAQKEELGVELASLRESVKALQDLAADEAEAFDQHDQLTAVNARLREENEHLKSILMDISTAARNHAE